jgi:protoporphyrinogen/coproporphyrinogen III oxidase
MSWVERALQPPKVLFSRRTAIKTVISGAMAAAPLGCHEMSDGESSAARLHVAAAAGQVGACPMQMHSEAFAHAHSKRDGAVFPKSDVKESVEVAIIGGGPSGLCALHALRHRDVVLLEKEPQAGGNCSSDSWEGVKFSTGAAFYTQGDIELVELMRSIGAPGQPIVGGDALIVRGQPFLDFMGDGARQLPFAAPVREAFQSSAEAARKLRHGQTSAALDAQTFADFLRPYPAELRAFWDRFGASNWGATSEHTSARLGLGAYTWLSGEEQRLSYPGGLGAATSALADYLERELPGRLRTSVFTHHIEPEAGGKSVLIHALVGKEPHAIRARKVIIAVPKFFAARILPHVHVAQRAAMTAFRYAPYPVFNVCLDGVGPEPAYDNWFLDAPFADFIPADWVRYAGRGPKDRKTVLTVYHPLSEGERGKLLDDEHLVRMADEVVLRLDDHFPGLKQKVAEVRIFRRGHALPMPTPGQLSRAELASRTQGPIVFAHSDSRGDVSSFPGALRAAQKAVAALS